MNEKIKGAKGKIDVNNTYIIRQAGSSQSTVLPAYEMNGCRHTDTAPPFVRDHVGSLWRTRQSPKGGHAGSVRFGRRRNCRRCRCC